MVPELKGLDVIRHEFPNLNAVHFVLRGPLGDGASTNLRVDHTGKAIGEYLRAKHIQIPDDLVESSAMSR